MTEFFIAFVITFFFFLFCEPIFSILIRLFGVYAIIQEGTCQV